MGKTAARAARATLIAGARAVLVAGAFAAALFCCRMAHAERPTVSVVPVAGDHAPADVRTRIGQSLAEGLIASGADVSAAPDEATYLLRGRVEIEGRSYTLHLEMLDRKTGSVVASREDRCEICTESEAFETANTAASTLKAMVFKRTGVGGPNGAAPGAKPTAGPPLASASPGLAAPAVSQGTPAPGASLAVSATPAPSERHAALGWTGVASGLAAGFAGAILIGIDGNGTCADYPAKACPNEYQTRAGGIALVAGGVVAVAAGVLALLGKL